MFKRDENGSVIIGVIIVVIIASIVIGIMAASIFSSMKLTDVNRNQTISKLNAESGIDQVSTVIKDEFNKTKSQNCPVDIKTSPVDQDDDLIPQPQDPQIEYEVSIKYSNNNVPSNCDNANEVTLTSVGKYKESEYTIITKYEIIDYTNIEGQEKKRLGSVIESRSTE